MQTTINKNQFYQLIKKLIYYQILIFVFCFSKSYSQSSFENHNRIDSLGYLYVTGNIEQNNKPLENASISIYEGSKKVAMIRTGENGKFNIKFEFNRYYKLEITKKNLVTKKFEFNTQLPLGKNNKAVYTFNFNIVLFPKYDYINMDILEKPLAIITFQKRYDDFFYNYEYAKSINDKVRYIETQVEKLTKEYGENVSAGRKLFDVKEYKLSLAKFKRANEIFPDEHYPVEQIAVLNKILNNEKINNELYDKLMAEAEDFVRQQKFDDAIKNLEQASNIKPLEKIPLQRIAEIKNTIELLAQKENKYKDALSKADNSFNNKNYKDAESEYRKAAELFPERSYPTTRLNEIEIIYSKLFSDDLYNKSVAEGDRLLAESKYKESIIAYQKALTYKSSEKYPEERIEYINTLLAKLSNIDNEYNDLISDADKLLSEKIYDKSKEHYLKAAKLKPNEQYPKDKLQYIENILAELKANEELYQNTLNDADKNFSNKDYQEALKLYTKALKIKPENEYPVKQIGKLTTLIAEEEKLKAKYQNLILIADNLLKDKKYAKAKIAYQDASLLKNNEKYPKDRISEIDKTFKEENDKLEEYWRIIEQADLSLDMLDFKKAKDLYLQASKINPVESYPVSKFAKMSDILEQKQSQEDLFSKFMINGDIALNSKSYNKAKELYLKALQIKPQDINVKEKLKEIDNIINSFNTNREIYDKYIKEADDMYDLKKYKEARDLYNNAHLLNPTQPYPEQRISEINEILRSEEYAKAIGEIDNELIEKMSEKKFSFNPISQRQENNSIIIEAKNLSKKPYKILIFYGRYENRSGGFELDAARSDSLEKYVIRVGKQNNWINQNNNWISIQPIGGDLEVNSIQIVKGN